VQCDSIAYIAYGKKLLDAPTIEIPKRVGLFAWRIEAAHLTDIASSLEGKPGVELVARFGTELHVCGSNEDALDAAVAPLQTQAGVRVEKIQAGLEEAFIHLMSGSQDNFQ